MRSSFYSSYIFKSCALTVSLLVLTACADGNLTDEPDSNEAVQISTVEVVKRSLTQIASGRAVVEQATPYIVTANERGAFESAVRVGDTVKKGAVIGNNAGTDILAPADSKVLSVADTSADLPKNYPLFELSYEGFAITLNTPELLKHVNVSSVSGNFQIESGVGPSECLAMVSGTQSAAMASNVNFNSGNTVKHTIPVAGKTEEAEQSANPQISTESVTCLIDKSLEVRAGQSAILVLKGITKDSVLTLPVNVVAGRLQKGTVIKTEADRQVEVEVGLGISDGANIEITSGLSEGDTVLAISPDLDPRGR